jgi:hypothetical protein
MELSRFFFMDGSGGSVDLTQFCGRIERKPCTTSPGTLYKIQAVYGRIEGKRRVGHTLRECMVQGNEPPSAPSHVNCTYDSRNRVYDCNLVATLSEFR